MKNLEGKAHKNTEQFAKYLAKLDVDSFFGVCKILKVELGTYGEDGKIEDMRPFETVWSEAIETFNSLGRAPRRQLLEVVKQSSRK